MAITRHLLTIIAHNSETIFLYRRYVLLDVERCLLYRGLQARHAKVTTMVYYPTTV